MDFFQQIDNIALLEPAAHFELFRSISNALNSKDSGIQAVGRNHLIKVIDVWEDVPSTLKPMWEDLIEAVGFYPYIEKYKMTLTDLDARIRQEYHRSEYIFDKTLHSKQKELSDLILSKQNVVVSAPTSFGKSLLIEEIVASGIYTNIVIIQPTLALLDETRIKLKRYFDMGGCEYLESRIDATEYGELLPTVDDAVCGLISILDAMNTGDNDRFHLETLHHSKQEIRRILERGGKIDHTVEYAVDDEDEEYEQYHGFSMRM